MKRAKKTEPKVVKPTPGPYSIREVTGCGFTVVGRNGVTVAWFGQNEIFSTEDGGHSIDRAEARANAETFVAWMRCLEPCGKAKRIQEAGK